MPAADFHEVQFPTNISLGAITSVTFKTTVIALRDGHEQRNVEWLEPLASYDVAPMITSQSELDTLIAFFRARGGQKNSFRFKDWLDFEATAVVLGTGDASRTQFQLLQTYASGITGDTYTATRPITKPLTDASEVIMLDGTPTALYTLDTATGVLTMDSAPGSGVVVSWTGDFDTPVRFDVTSLQTRIELHHQYQQALNLIEDRIPATVFQWTEAAVPEFVEARLPNTLFEPTAGGPGHDTVILSADSGVEDRTQRWTESRIPYATTMMARSKTEMATVLAFFRSRKGRGTGFRFKDVSDFEATAEVIGTGDTIETAFQMTKTYSSGGETEVRTITKPLTDGSETILLDAVPTALYTLDTATGIVTMTSPPGAGVVVTWTGEFDTPMRFDTDTFRAQLNTLDERNWLDVSMIEVLTSAIGGTYLAGTTGRVSSGVTGCLGTPYYPDAPGTLVVRFSGSVASGDTLKWFAAAAQPARSFHTAAMKRATAVTFWFVVSNVSLTAGDGETLLNINTDYAWIQLQLKILKSGGDQGKLQVKASNGNHKTSLVGAFTTTSTLHSELGSIFPAAGIIGDATDNGDLFVRYLEAPFTNTTQATVTTNDDDDITVSGSPFTIDPVPPTIGPFPAFTIENNHAVTLTSDDPIGTITSNVVEDVCVLGVYINYSTNKMVLLGSVAGFTTPAWWPGDLTWIDGGDTSNHPAIGAFHDGSIPSTSNGQSFDLHEMLFQVHRQRDDVAQIDPIVELQKTLDYFQLKYKNNIAVPLGPIDLRGWYLPEHGTDRDPASPGVISQWDSAENYLLLGHDNGFDTGFGLTEPTAFAPNMVELGTLPPLDADLKALVPAHFMPGT